MPRDHYEKKPVECNDSRKCFAKTSTKKCLVLSEAYDRDGQCPFCKEYIDDRVVRRK